MINNLKYMYKFSPGALQRYMKMVFMFLVHGETVVKTVLLT